MSSIRSTLLDTSTAIAASQASNVASVPRIVLADVTAVIAGANQASQVFTANAGTEIATTVADHGYTTGVLVTVTNSGGALPTGLLTLTNYYLIVVSANTVKFAVSQADALAGTAIDLTSNGTGTNTIVPQTTLAGSIKLQKTNDDPNGAVIEWVDLVNAEVLTGANSQTISAASTKNWALASMGFTALRALVTVTSGTLTARVQMTGKSQN